MKKALATILAATVLCGVCATGVLTAGHHGGAWSTATARVCSWADGSCANHTCRNDADGDGTCEVCGAACAAGTNAHHGHGAGHGRCGR